MIQETLHIKNMLCSCCIKLIELEFEKAGIKTIKIRAGFAIIEFNSEVIKLEIIDEILGQHGMSLIKTRDQKIVEQIKTAVIELIHHSNNINSLLRKSEYLVEKLNLSYQQLSKLFSRHESITLEKIYYSK